MQVSVQLVLVLIIAKIIDNDLFQATGHSLSATVI